MINYVAHVVRENSWEREKKLYSKNKMRNSDMITLNSNDDLILMTLMSISVYYDQEKKMLFQTKIWKNINRFNVWLLLISSHAMIHSSHHHHIKPIKPITFIQSLTLTKTNEIIMKNYYDRHTRRIYVAAHEGLQHMCFHHFLRHIWIINYEIRKETKNLMCAHV